ncbi:uncharacterized protein [Dermacentor albipictus]|uniref:uncharacterized protein n=1 Tax=Dermacentor albipictus TaxID=60249 RepID=UPI0031FDF408
MAFLMEGRPGSREIRGDIEKKKLGAELFFRPGVDFCADTRSCHLLGQGQCYGSQPRIRATSTAPHPRGLQGGSPADNDRHGSTPQLFRGEAHQARNRCGDGTAACANSWRL